ncbi:hypothetical protein [Microbacterium sp. GXF7504]
MPARGDVKRRGHELFAPIEDDLLTRDGVEVGPMFGSDGLRIRGKVFAFIGWDGGLIVKLPAARVASWPADSAAMPMVMRGRTMREWLVVPQSEADTWPGIVHEAFTYVDAITP